MCSPGTQSPASGQCSATQWQPLPSLEMCLFMFLMFSVSERFLSSGNQYLLSVVITLLTFRTLLTVCQAIYRHDLLPKKWGTILVISVFRGSRCSRIAALSPWVTLSIFLHDLDAAIAIANTQPLSLRDPETRVCILMYILWVPKGTEKLVATLGAL